MATHKTRLEALEAKTPTGAGIYCLVVHTAACAKARQDAIAEYVAQNGCEPVNFVDIMLASPDGGNTCKCKGLEDQPFTVSGPNASGIMAELVAQAGGTALSVVKDPVQ